MVLGKLLPDAIVASQSEAAVQSVKVPDCVPREELLDAAASPREAVTGAGESAAACNGQRCPLSGQRCPLLLP